MCRKLSLLLLGLTRACHFLLLNGDSDCETIGGETNELVSIVFKIYFIIFNPYIFRFLMCIVLLFYDGFIWFYFNVYL